MTTPERPEFALVMRGYERPQVDEFVATQAEQLQSAIEQRDAAAAEAARLRREVEEQRARLQTYEERELTETPKSLDVVGERVGTILRSAWDAAEAMRTEAQAEVESVRAEAEREGRERAERLLEENRRLRAELEGELNVLTRKRDAVRGELQHLRSVLESALGPAAAPEAEAEAERETGENTDEVVDLREPQPTVATPITPGAIRRVI